MDVQFQNFSTVQSKAQPTPKRVVTTTTIAALTVTPESFMTILTGATTGTLGTITPPVTGQHMLAIVATSAAGTNVTTTTSGNIANVITFVTNTPALFFYDPVSAKYFARA